MRPALIWLSLRKNRQEVRETDDDQGGGASGTHTRCGLRPAR
jgi:hypothetical protein